MIDIILVTILFLFIFWYIPGFCSIALFLNYDNITINDIMMTFIIGLGGWYSAYHIYKIYKINKILKNGDINKIK